MPAAHKRHDEGAALSPEPTRKLLHELRVHQIELEMQNEELRRAQVEMEAARLRYFDLYDLAPVGYCTVSEQGLILQANLAAATLLCLSREALTRQPICRFICKADQDIYYLCRRRLVASGDAQTCELRIVNSDGTPFWVQLAVTAVREADGAAVMRVVLNDIDQRKRMESALHASEALMRQAMEEAREANRAKSDFLSSMSHELRTPLGTVLGFAQLMESGTPAPTPSQKRSIDQILRAGWYLLELINDLLDLALIESGKLVLAPEPMALAELMLECRAMVEPQAHKRAIVLSCPPVDRPYFVNADRMRIKQVLINLLSNAIKYNREGGTVVMQCVAATPERIRICVTDTGQGLAPEQTAQLFQPFNRLGQEATAEEGTGIGLVMCKRLIELMGGAIGVQSTVGQGSVFWIEMNLAPQPPAAVAAPELMLAARTQNASASPLRTLLYVEDNAANLMLMQELIARRPDMRLLSARDARDGIKLARASRPDAILMDVNLSGVDGIDALQILALDPVTAHIPVIALSASAMPHDIEKGLAAGFLRYLTKPIKVDAFMETLDETLEFARAASDRAAMHGGVA